MEELLYCLNETFAHCWYFLGILGLHTKVKYEDFPLSSRG